MRDEPIKGTDECSIRPGEAGTGDLALDHVKGVITRTCALRDIEFAQEVRIESSIADGFVTSAFNDQARPTDPMVVDRHLERLAQTFQ
jgi:hypothetical protein